jgi:arginase
MRYASVVGLPIYTLSKYSDMGNGPEWLRKAGLLTALGSPVLDEGDIELPRLERDVLEGGIKNLAYFRDATSRFQESLRSLRAERVVLVGGECSLVVGGLSGLMEAFGERAGMLWMDAHGDFNTPESSPSSYIGGMCLAMVCGRVSGLGGAVDADRPLLSEENLVHLGSRALDPGEAKAFETSPAKLLTMDDLRKGGVRKVAAEIARHLADRADWIVCHLDVDVVDPSSVLAVNYPTPGGLKPAEASAIIKSLDATGKLKALDIAAYNPSLDYDGSSAAAIVSLIKQSFG